jgi:NAD(P) transhydrogenase subunit alpha
MTREGSFAPDFEDEIVTGMSVTHQGNITHEQTRQTVEGEA